MSNTFRPTYRELTSDETVAIDKIKNAASELEALIRLKTGREVSLAITKLEECVMWGVKAFTA